MLKLKIIRNIGLIISVIIVIQILLIFPDKHEYITKTDANISDIYLFDNNDYVAKLNIQVKSKETNQLIEEIISLMTENNPEEYRLRAGFKAPIPRETKLLSHSLNDGILTLNFSKEFLNINEKMEEKMIEALIYTLTSIEGVNAITIKVDDNSFNKLQYSNVVLPNVLDRSFKINKEYDDFSLNDLKEVTIFYPASINDFIYYIPVTKYTNNKKEKIEIIIDELKSSSTYNTNLISYINEETELINYELIDKSFILNFTNSIFTDINSKTIKEEITYSINASVKETYKEVDNVLYCVDDDIINNYFLLLG